MRPWKLRGDTITLRIGHQAATALAESCDDLIRALDARDDESLLRRLLPSAYPDDPEAAEDFRRFTAEGLVDGKRANAALMLAQLDESGVLDHGVRQPRRGVPIPLSREEAWAWLRVFTDLRQAIAARLGIESDDDTDRIYHHPPDEDTAWQIMVFEWLADLQHSLVSTLDGY